MSEFVEISNVDINNIDDAHSVIDRYNINKSDAIITLKFALRMDPEFTNYSNAIYNKIKFNYYKGSNINVFLDYINLMIKYKNEIFWFINDFYKYHNTVSMTRFKYLQTKRVLERLRVAMNSDIKINYQLNYEVLNFVNRAAHSNYRLYNGIRIGFYRTDLYYVDLPFMQLQGNHITEPLNKYLAIDKKLESRLTRLKINNLKQL